MRQKGFAPIIILLIILVLFGIVGGMVYFKGKTNQLKSLEPQVSPVPSTSQSNQTADWKKYNNETLMLSFQYPKDWVVKTAMFSGDPEEISYPVLDIDSDQGLIASLSYFDNPDNLPLSALEEKRKKKELYGMAPAIYLSSDQAIKIGEISGYYRKDTLCEPVMCDIYVWSNKGKVFVLMNFKDPMNGQGQLFNNLLSTFHFTDKSIDTMENWKSYTNTKYNYTIQYPPDWDKMEGDNGNYARFFKGTYNPNQPMPQTYIFISSKPNQSKKPVRDWLIEEGILPADNNISTHIGEKNITVGGIPGMQISTPVNGGQDTTYIPIDSQILQITYVFKSETPEDNIDVVNTYNQILSTFRFFVN